MLATDETALVCDLAESYGIYDYKKYPATTIAMLAVGLRENARIKMKINKMAYPLETMLLASAVDKLSLILWSKTKDGSKGINRPKMITEMLSAQEQNQNIQVFVSTDTFEETWKQLAGGERIGRN